MFHDRSRKFLEIFRDELAFLEDELDFVRSEPKPLKRGTWMRYANDSAVVTVDFEALDRIVVGQVWRRSPQVSGCTGPVDPYLKDPSLNGQPWIPLSVLGELRNPNWEDPRNLKSPAHLRAAAQLIAETFGFYRDDVLRGDFDSWTPEERERLESLGWPKYE